MPSASDGLAAVAGVGEGDERTIASCPRALAVIEVDATKQNNQRRVICKILSGFPRDRDSTKPIEEGKLYCAMSRHAIGIRSLAVGRHRYMQACFSREFLIESECGSYGWMTR